MDMKILISMEVIENAIIDACVETEKRYLAENPKAIWAVDQAISAAKSQMDIDPQLESDTLKLNALLDGEDTEA